MEEPRAGIVGAPDRNHREVPRETAVQGPSSYNRSKLEKWNWLVDGALILAVCP